MANKNNTIELHIKKYLSELNLSSDVFNHHTSLIVSATGSGKSYWVSNFLLKSINKDEIIIFATPTIATATQFYNDYSKNNSDGALFTGGKKSTNFRKAKIIFTTHSSCRNLLSNLSLPNDKIIFVFDESHTLTTASNINFRYKEMKFIVNNYKSFKHFIMLTATPVTNKSITIDKTYYIKRSENKQVTYTTLDVLNLIPQTNVAARLAIEHANAGRNVIIHLNNTSDNHIFGKLKNMIKALGGEEDLSIINSTTKESEDFIDIVTFGKLGKPITLSSSVMNEGISIYDDKPVTIITLGDWSPTDVVQMSARCRLSSDVKIIAIKNNSYDKDYNEIDSSVFMEHAEGYVTAAKYMDMLDEKLKQKTNIESERFISKSCGITDCIIRKNGEYIVDTLLIDNYTYNQNNKQLYDNKYNFCLELCKIINITGDENSWDFVFEDYNKKLANKHKLSKDEKLNLVEHENKTIEDNQLKTKVILESIKNETVDSIQVFLHERIDCNDKPMDKFTENIYKIVKNVAEAASIEGELMKVVDYVKKNKPTINDTRKLMYTKMIHEIMGNPEHAFYNDFVTLKTNVKPGSKLTSDTKRLIVIKHLEKWFRYLAVEMNQKSLSNVFDALFISKTKTIRVGLEVFDQCEVVDYTKKLEL